MNCKQALRKWQAKSNKTQAAKIEKTLAAMERRPFLGRVVENAILHSYERAQGKKIVGAPDWNAILQWLIDNGPTILKIIMSILVLF